MRNRFLFVLFAALLLSCSGDDNVTVNEPNEPNEPFTKEIRSITTYYGNNTEPNILIKFLNNHPVEVHLKVGTQPLQLHEKYYYFNFGSRVSYIEGYDLYDGQPGIDYKVDFDYDEYGRLIHEKTTYYGDWTSDFDSYYTYNEDNTITADHDPGGMVVDTYFLNSSGQIFKMEGNENLDLVREITYDGNNILSYLETNNSGGMALNYTYDMQTQVKGNYLTFYQEMFGNNANLILYNNSLYYTLQVSDNYMTSEGSVQGLMYTYEYEFDADGYPITKKKISINGNLASTDIIEYRSH